MTETIKIEVLRQKQYSLGAFHSGIPLLHSVIIHNASLCHLRNLKLRIQSDSPILSQWESELKLLAPNCKKVISCQTFLPDAKLLVQLVAPISVSLKISLFSQKGELLRCIDTSCSFLPFDFSYGIPQKIESLAFLVTPQQPLEGFPELSFTDESPLRQLEAVFDTVKSRRITYLSDFAWHREEHSLRLCERVWKEGYANSVELSLLALSILEKYGLSPILGYCKGKTYFGMDCGKNQGSVLEKIGANQILSQNLILVDSADLAFGSEKDLNSAIRSTQNALSLSDETVLLLRIQKARELGLSSLPNRKWNGSRFLPEGISISEDISFLPEDFYRYMKHYGNHPVVNAILTNKRFSSPQQATDFKYIPTLDVNQNRIYQKILSSDFTLIKSNPGSGTSTVFSHAALEEIKKGKKVLYLTDPNYHKNGFSDACSRLFSPDFLFDLSCLSEKIPAEIPLHFYEPEDISSILNQLEQSEQKLDSYYHDLEGTKSIVSSFFSAADRYQQLRDANDTIIFSPEQIGTLSNEMVQNWFSIVNECDKIFSEIQEIKKNPLGLIRKREFSYEYKSSLIQQLEEILRVLENLISTRNLISAHFPSLGRIETQASLHTFNELILLFCEFKRVPISIFEDSSKIESIFRTATSLIQAKNENDVIRHIIKVSFEEEIFSLNATELYQKYLSLQNDKGFRAISQKYAILRSVKRFLRPNCDVENMEYILSRLNDFEKNRTFIQNEAETVFHLFSVLKDDSENCWKELQSTKDLCYQCNYIFQKHFPADRIFAFSCDFCRAYENEYIKNSLDQLQSLEKQLQNSFKQLNCLILNQSEQYFNPEDEDHFSVYYREFSAVLSATDNLKSWCSWLMIRDSALNAGMKNMILAIDNGTVTQSELKRSFLRAFFKAVCEYNYIAHPDLIPEKFNVSDEQAKWMAYNEKKFSTENRITDFILSERRSLASMNLKGASLSDCLRNNPEQFFGLYPCIVSDPKTAKLLFEDSAVKFDLILMEHRAPISLEEIFWIFHSSRKVAFAGQLHSVDKRIDQCDYFNSSAFDCIWQLCEDRVSLSSCYGQKSHLCTLRSMITAAEGPFTRTYSVPSAASHRLIHWIPVLGHYNSEFPKVNLEEAKSAVRQVQILLSQKKQKRINVICATSEQAQVILLLLQEAFSESEEKLTLRDSVSVLTSEDPIEMADIVIFSTVYASDRNRHNDSLPFEFLELGRNMPFSLFERMIASAKEQFVLVTSIQKQDLKNSSSLFLSVLAFSVLMEYADLEECNASYESIEGAPDSNVLSGLSGELAQRGYRTIFGLRSGRYYFDLAVLDDNGVFQLGILSDQTILGQQAHISSIEIFNQKLYEQNGWRVYRLRSTNCFDSFENEVNQIISVLEGETCQREILSF